MPTIRDVTNTLEAWAPPASAQDYDNVGLQVGEADRSIERALVALDLTHTVIDEAKRREASLIVTHHPLLFRPLSRLTPDTREGALALRLAEAGIALYTAHTNLDAAHGGVSFALAERLGLTGVDFMDGFPDAVRKLVTFVPRDHFDAVRAALAEAGAGQIGDYEACAFASEGTGYFRPTEGADPHTGSSGELERADEVRLEAEVARWDLAGALRALREAHPYEEVAYDVYPLEQKYSRAGLGAIGTLTEPEPLSTFLGRVADRLDAGSLRYAGDDDALVKRVAVCGGAGSNFVGTALGAGADAYVTADVKYHDYFEVLDSDDGAPQMAFINAGHYETEALTEQLLVDWLGERLARVEWMRTEKRTSPVKTFVAE
jgi:dinuclear metal center YbgI/SA1388 family protein